MEMNDYIDYDEGYRFRGATENVAVLECLNCNRVVDRLTLVPEFDYMGCDDCMEDALAVIASEQQELLIEKRAA